MWACERSRFHVASLLLILNADLKLVDDYVWYGMVWYGIIQLTQQQGNSARSLAMIGGYVDILDLIGLLLLHRNHGIIESDLARAQ